MLLNDVCNQCKQLSGNTCRKKRLRGRQTLKLATVTQQKLANNYWAFVE